VFGHKKTWCFLFITEDLHIWTSNFLNGLLPRPHPMTPTIKPLVLRWGMQGCWSIMPSRLEIKADRPLTCDTLNAPWLLTDNFNGLVMVIRNYHWLNSASRVLLSTCSAPLVQTGERKQFSLFDLDLWPTILTYNPRLAKVKVDPHAKNQGQMVHGQRSNGSNRRAPTDKRTLPNVLSPLLRGR